MENAIARKNPFIKFSGAFNALKENGIMALSVVYDSQRESVNVFKWGVK